ncbi:flavodoxin family protein [Pseudaestuariivita atlantica]|uniref:flavodoxin family protein n=1 Tax=Pseudaestuariivita atlantica TaxID=1317121 RepID=UPI00106B836E|nr:flavodoxin family protein [Pseudaestuariivita atlantica]
MPQKPSSILIYVYSRSGHSRRVAEHLGNYLGVAPFEVTTCRYSWPVLSWITAARDGMRGRAVPLDQSLDLPEGGLVVLVGPVWAGGVGAPLNTLIDALANGEQDVAVLLTCDDPNELTASLHKIAERLRRPLKGKMVLSNGVQDTSEGHERIRAFAEALGVQVTAQ